MPLRHLLCGPLPAEPVADGVPHHQLLVPALEPRQLLGEHRHTLPIGARHAGDVSAPEAALRAERVDDLADVFVDVAVGVGLATLSFVIAFVSGRYIGLGVVSAAVLPHLLSGQLGLSVSHKGARASWLVSGLQPHSAVSVRV